MSSTERATPVVPRRRPGGLSVLRLPPGLRVSPAEGRGQNWKDWNKQILNAATAIDARGIIKGDTPAPGFQDNDLCWEEMTLRRPQLTTEMDTDAIQKELKAAEEYNKYIRPLNNDKCTEKLRRKQEYGHWHTRDGHLVCAKFYSLSAP
ncbi:hypothetical protein BU25DRAFT_493580 [Macroventuria anomochaeta]|uniref:Uncharacterized protein n=1 Tax=Macroventuria anomochaeta TaxID=301207 RepID=A0ACB6RRT3_9PLEO|nr:uncharacterized protein BU25DRAFT_493580 [Macroventuria anomochaeta]KAF2624616.1 hypothetical protein BU25DRAFT_493580 [Macroventuria anomochaeta]